MMDFGFGAFLEKLEAAFGIRVTKAILILIASAVATTCISIVFNTLVKPVLTFINKDWSDPAGIITFANGLAIFFVVTSGAALASYLIDAARMKETNRKAEEILTRAEAAQEANQETEDRWRETMDSTIRMTKDLTTVIVAGRLIYESIAKAAIDRNIMNQAEVDDLIGIDLARLDYCIETLAALDTSVDATDVRYE